MAETPMCGVYDRICELESVLGALNARVSTFRPRGFDLDVIAGEFKTELSPYQLNDERIFLGAEIVVCFACRPNVFYSIHDNDGKFLVREHQIKPYEPAA